MSQDGETGPVGPDAARGEPPAPGVLSGSARGAGADALGGDSGASAGRPGGAGAGHSGADGGGGAGAGNAGGTGAAGAGGGAGAGHEGGTGSVGGEPGPAGEGPAGLLGEVRAIRRRTRLARHAYWFPLVLFGLLIGASVPFYLRRIPSGRGPVAGNIQPPNFLQRSYLGGMAPVLSGRATAYYWLGAILLGIAATGLWYRWRGNRVGIRTPARGYLLTGLIVVALALLIPLVGRRGGAAMVLLMPGDLVIRGTFPLVLIGLGLCFLAWAERSAALAIITSGYLALSLVASLYDIENVFYNWFGWNLDPTASSLPNVLLPALVLLLAGAGAWVVQRRQRPPAAEG